MTSHIRPGQVYASVRPGGQERVRVRSYDPDRSGTVEVVDAGTEANSRRVNACLLRTSDEGKELVSGFVLVEDAPEQVQAAVAAAAFPDSVIEVVITQVRNRTGRNIDPGAAAVVAENILRGQKVSAPASYLVHAIDNAFFEGDLALLGIEDVPAGNAAAARYRTRRPTVMALQWDGRSLDVLQQLVGGENVQVLDRQECLGFCCPQGTVRVTDPGGHEHTLMPGEWILRHNNDESLDDSIETLPSYLFDERYAPDDDAVVPQVAVDAVLESWRTAYEKGNDDYEPDPSHAGIVREALHVAWPHLYGTFLEAQAADGRRQYEEDAMATAVSPEEAAECDQVFEAAMDAQDDAARAAALAADEL